jgi:hypothetical protein
MNANDSIWLAEFMKLVEATMPEPELMYANSMLAIVAKYGKLADNDGKGIWVGYVEPEDNDNLEIGVKCGNCYLHESDNVCKIVARPIEPDGYCRLAAIPDGVVKSSRMGDEPDDEPDDQ